MTYMIPTSMELVFADALRGFEQTASGVNEHDAVWECRKCLRGNTIPDEHVRSMLARIASRQLEQNRFGK